jgi:fructuronate reductase
MKLNISSIINESSKWEESGFVLPRFDIGAVRARTLEHPRWIHFGAGNIFRAFPAAVLQRLLDEGDASSGLIVAESFDTEIIEKAYRPFDNLSALVILKSDGTIEKKIIASVCESLIAVPGSADWERTVAVFRNPSLQIASFTVTEKGYAVKLPSGEIMPGTARDIEAGPGHPRTLMGIVTALCLERFLHGAPPLALTSMDNCSHNGIVLLNAVMLIAGGWIARGFADPAFLSYLSDPAKISFPCSMIDKITPRPDARVGKMLSDGGFENADVIVTDKKTFTSAFVNAEQTEYLVIEDFFPNGRPPLEKGGFFFTDRDTVDRAERMKVCTCLNPLHTALAVFGCLLSYTSICEEMKDPLLVKLISRIGYEEGLPVVIDPGIIRPRDFIDEVINVRLPNPFMPDTPQRIASDTSQKLPIRFGETIKAYMNRGMNEQKSLTGIPLVFAGWCRYLMGVDDGGNRFDPSPDPLLESVRAHVAGIRLGSPGDFRDNLRPLLSDASIFGVDLYAAGLGEKVELLFARMTAGKGEVRSTLEEYI